MLNLGWPTKQFDQPTGTQTCRKCIEEPLGCNSLKSCHVMTGLSSIARGSPHTLPICQISRQITWGNHNIVAFNPIH